MACPRPCDVSKDVGGCAQASGKLPGALVCPCDKMPDFVKKCKVQGRKNVAERGKLPHREPAPGGGPKAALSAPRESATTRSHPAMRLRLVPRPPGKARHEKLHASPPLFLAVSWPARAVPRVRAHGGRAVEPEFHSHLPCAEDPGNPAKLARM